MVLTIRELLVFTKDSNKQLAKIKEIWNQASPMASLLKYEKEK